MATISAVPRKFKIGVALVADPAPSMSLDTCLQLLSHTYPQARWTKLYEEDAVFEDGALVYSLITPPVKTNG